MIKHPARKFTLVLTLLLLTAPIGTTFAQSIPAPAANAVGGTDPEPQGDIVQRILTALGIK